MTTPLKARVVLADDHAVLRESLASVLEAEPDFTVVAQVGDGAAALQEVLRTEVDLALLDISMPKMTGIDVALHIAEQRPATRVVFLTMHDREDLLYRALETGASGYVLKSTAVAELVEAARAALRGEVILRPAHLRALAEAYLEGATEGAQPRGPLSDREIQVLKLVAEGHSSAEIARILMISPKTVARHRDNTLSKLGLNDRVGLTRYAIRNGLVAP